MLTILSLSDLKHFALQTKHTHRHTENVLCLDSLIDLTMMIIMSVTRKYKFCRVLFICFPASKLW